MSRVESSRVESSRVESSTTTPRANDEPRSVLIMSGHMCYALTRPRCKLAVGLSAAPPLA